MYMFLIHLIWYATKYIDNKTFSLYPWRKQSLIETVNFSNKVMTKVTKQKKGGFTLLVLIDTNHIYYSEPPILWTL